MRRISQRELRNDNAAIMKDVEQGESFTVTRRGVPVARLVPIADAVDLRLVRPAKVQAPFARIQRVDSTISTEQILTELRGDR